MNVRPFILACFATCMAEAQTDSGSAFVVHVVNSLTRAPIAGANVVLADAQGENLWGRTDAGGAFTGRVRSAGSHLLTVTCKGFRMTGGVAMGNMVEVRAGVETEAAMEMLPLGILAGRVLDQYGDPVRHAVVRTEDKISPEGLDEHYESYSSGITDDRGEYRVTEVEPGKHFLAVEYSNTAGDRNSGTRSRYRWPKTGGLVLYPDAAGIDQAEQVHVAAGETIRLNDVHLKIQRAAAISGRVKLPLTANNAFVNLQRVSGLALNSSPMVQGAAVEANGYFKIEVLPGTYLLTASEGLNGKISEPLTVEVREKDITGLELELTSGYEISGRIVVDGPERIDFSKLILSIGGPRVKVGRDGTFGTSLSGSKGFYLLQGLPENWYVKAVQVAGKQIVGRQFETAPGSTEVILTISPRGASVSITLEGAVSGPGAVYAVLLPESGGVPDIESLLHGEADRSGTFTIRAIPPDSYRVFTLDASNWALLMRPDVLLEKYRKLAPLISVVEGERKALVLPSVKIQPQ
jgi:hypothetical protein